MLTGVLDHNRSYAPPSLAKKGEEPTGQSALVAVRCISLNTWTVPIGKPAKSSFPRGALSYNSGKVAAMAASTQPTLILTKREL